MNTLSSDTLSDPITRESLIEAQNVDPALTKTKQSALSEAEGIHSRPLLLHERWGITEKVEAH